MYSENVKATVCEILDWVGKLQNVTGQTQYPVVRISGADWNAACEIVQKAVDTGIKDYEKLFETK